MFRKIVEAPNTSTRSHAQVCSISIAVLTVLLCSCDPDDSVVELGRIEYFESPF